MAFDSPVIWPEDPTPGNLKNCRDCGLIEHGSRMIWGEGNPHASIMVLLDNPGAREDREGNPFVCGTRQTLQQAANEAGLKMDDIYVTFILKRKPVRAYDKKAAREICMQHLQSQLNEKQPRLIFCLGNVAVQSFFQSEDADVKSLRGGIHHARGFNVTVAYHPLAVRRRPNLWPYFKEDWQKVADYYRSEIR